MIPTLIWIWRVQWRCSFSLLSFESNLFLFNLKFGTYTNSNMYNLMVIFIFLDRKYHFWVNLVEKSKIASFSWNLVHRIVRIFHIRGDVHVSCFGKNSFVILLIPDWSPGTLLAETWSRWLFLFQLKDERSQASNPHFRFSGNQTWSEIRKFLFKL